MSNMVYIAILLILVAIVAVTIAYSTNKKYNELVGHAAKLSKEAVSLKDLTEKYIKSVDHYKRVYEAEQAERKDLEETNSALATENASLKKKLSRKGTGKKGAKKEG